MKKRVIIAGLGDTGLLVAVALSEAFDVVGITPKPCLVSGQEVGGRLTWPTAWKENYFVHFRRYKRLDNVRVVQGFIASINMDTSEVCIKLPDGTEYIEPYDALVISSGVQNGFWKNNDLDSIASAEAKIDAICQQVAAAHTVAIIGGGATGVSIAGNVAERYRDKSVHLFHSRDYLLPGYHPRVQAQMKTQLLKLQVRLHAHHRAKIPDGFACDRLTSDPIEWETGQSPFRADVVIWTVGKISPNNTFIPPEILDHDGFVKVEPTLQVSGHRNVFAVGDIAASDANRSSARNDGADIVAHNIRKLLSGAPSAMKQYKPTPHRWGSILGLQKTGLRVFTPNGISLWFPRWVVDWLLYPLIVHRLIYKGIRTKEQTHALGAKQPDTHVS